MAANIRITNKAALVVGLTARRHPDCSVQIEWREGEPEMLWFITADNGTEEWVYVVDDESGTNAPLSPEELRLFKNGETVFPEMLRRFKNADTVFTEVAATREP